MTAPSWRKRRKQADDPLLEYVQEDAFQKQVQQYAADMGWKLQYHVTDSRKDNPGWPDLWLVHPVAERLVVAELKKIGKYPRAEQRVWLDALSSMANAIGSPRFQVYVWDPRDWDEIERVLTVEER